MRFKRRKIEAVPPYVSMADIAFNLVLFFLILAKTQDDSHLKWEPAKATGTKAVTNAKVSVTVDRDEKVYLNGEQVGLLPDASGRSLETRVADEIANRPEGEKVVLLKIHKDTLAARFEMVMEAVSKAGGEVVHVLDEELP